MSIIFCTLLMPYFAAASAMPRLTHEEEHILRTYGIIKKSKSLSGTNLKEAIGIGLIDAVPSVIWDVITDYNNYKDFMPRTAKSEVTDRMGDTIYFFSELDMPLPMPNVSYEIALKADKKHFIIFLE